VTLTTSGAANQTGQGENTSNFQSDFQVTTDVTVTPGAFAIGTPIDLAFAFATPVFTLPAFDGTFDFLGPSSIVLDPQSDSDLQADLFSDSASLAAVTGTGMLDLNVAANAVTVVDTTGGNFVVDQVTVASYEIEICYRYEPLQTTTTTTTTTTATTTTTSPGASTSPSTSPPAGSSSPPVTGAGAPSPSSPGGAPVEESPVLPATGGSAAAQALLALVLVGAGAILLSPRSARGGTASSRTR
jgi:hypothetical protein